MSAEPPLIRHQLHTRHMCAGSLHCCILQKLPVFQYDVAMLIGQGAHLHIAEACEREGSLRNKCAGKQGAEGRWCAVHRRWA